MGIVSWFFRGGFCELLNVPNNYVLIILNIYFVSILYHKILKLFMIFKIISCDIDYMFFVRSNFIVI